MINKVRKLPAIQFYPGDWLKDTNLRMCSIAARGAYIDIICLMHEAENRGVLRTKMKPISVKKLSKSVAGCKPKLVLELIENGVVRVARKDGAMYSKRMVRDELHRRHKAISGQKGGKTKPSKPQANPQANRGSSSSSSSSIKNKKERKTPKPPEGVVVFPTGLQGNGFEKIWAEWEKHRREKKCKITPCARSRQLNRLAKLGKEKAVEIITYSIEQGYQGLIDPGGRGGPKRNQEPVSKTAIREYRKRKEAGEL